MASERGGKGTDEVAQRLLEPHVLAVDDSSVDRAVITNVLRSSKYRVTAVDSGKRALELLGLVLWIITSLPSSLAGIVPVEGDPCRDHVLRERAEPDQQLFGGGSGGFFAEAHPAVGCVTLVQLGLGMTTVGSDIGFDEWAPFECRVFFFPLDIMLEFIMDGKRRAMDGKNVTFVVSDPCLGYLQKIIKDG